MGESLGTERHTRGARIVVAAGVALVGLLLANLISFGYGRDQGIYDVVAATIARGSAPYAGAWDFKPPGVYFVFSFAHAVFGDGPHAVRVLEAILWATVPLAFARVTKRNGRALVGFGAGVFAVYCHVRLEFWHTAQPESFGAVALVWALVLAGEPARRRATTLGRWAAIGALFAFAALAKPPLGGGVVLLLALEMRERGWRAFRAWGPLAVAAAVGAAVPLAATWAFYASRGAWGALVDAVFHFAPHYTALDFKATRLPFFLVRVAKELLFYFTPALAPAALVATRLVPRELRAEVDATRTAAVLLPCALGVALQAKFFAYHYSACLPFMCLLATAAYVALYERFVRARLGLVPKLALAAVVLVALVAPPLANRAATPFWARVPMRFDAALNPDRRAQLVDAMTSENDVRADENRALVDWVDAHTTGDSSFYLWGFEPQVYASANRRPASRYVYDVPQRVAWSRADACAAMMTDLARDPPSAVAVEAGDRFEWVTGTDADSRESLGACPGFASWLADGYRETWHSPRFDVYALRAPP